MSRRRLPAVLLALALLASGCGGGSGEAAPAGGDRRADARVGQPLPDLTFASLTGDEPLRLPELEGPAVVNLWASWCAPCRRELPLYQQFAEQYAGRVQVVGVDWQDTQADAARQLATESGVTYPLYADPDGRLRALGLPRVVLVDAEGTVTHSEYVEIKDLAQLEELVATHLEVAP